MAAINMSLPPMSRPRPGQVRTNPTVLFGSGIIERQRDELLP
jgi:hypothetical protein